MNLGMLTGFGRRSQNGFRGPMASALASYTLITNVLTQSNNARAVSVLSGATTAGVLKQALRVTGRGCLNWSAIYANDATSRTLRLVIWVDGRRIVNNTSAAVAQTNDGFIGVGSINAYQPIDFQRELKIQFASSVAAETDKVSIAYNVEVFAS